MSTTTGQWESRMVAMEQEQSVLGALLRNNQAVDAIGDLTAEHFYSSAHREIFKAIMALLHANRPADVITVYDRLQAGSKDPNADLAYLSKLHQSTPSAVHARSYAAIVRDRAVKRGLVDLAHDAIEQATHSPEDGAALVDKLATKLESLARVSATSEPELAAQELTAHVTMIDQLHSGGDSPAIPTGLSDIDAALNGGPRRGHLVVLAGRPKMGKTALALNIATHVAVTGIAAVLSLEMTKPELHNRNLASVGRIQLSNLNDPKLMSTEDFSRLTGAVEKIGAMRLYLDDQAGLSLMQVAAKAKQIKRKAGGLDLLVIDYLQLMSGPGDNRNAQIEAITRGLKSLAKDLGIVIVLLSQLNRKLEERPNKRPMPSDLRDSGSIEQDCDVAIFVYRDEVYNQESPDKGICEANIGLNRHGATRVVPLTYLGEYVRFESAARNWHPAAPRTPAAPMRRGFD